METMLGQTLGQYRIVEQIGKGGMATVFKAYQPGLDRYVAIKVLPAYYAHEEGFSERFVREAKAIARLDHPHILPVYDFGQADGLSYIVMKYVAAGTLKDRLGQPLAPQAALDLLKQIGAALDHAHDMGILHRDVKPGNVLIDEKGWTYLSDFGLAKMVEGSVQLTGSGVGIGTPAYMSPEQGQGLAVDGRTDVYSLGIILYEMLTGRVPYEADTPMAVVVKHITGPLPPPRSLNPAISPAVERVILKALARDPADRFPRAGALVEALEAALSQARQEPTAVPPPAPVPLPQMQPSAQPPSAQPPLGIGMPATQAPVSWPTVTPPVPARAKQSNTLIFAMIGMVGLALVGSVLLIVVLLVVMRPGAPTSDATSVLLMTPTLPAMVAVVPTNTPLPAVRATQAPQAPQATAPAALPAPIPQATSNPTPTPLPTSTSRPADTPLAPTYTPTALPSAQPPIGTPTPPSVAATPALAWIAIPGGNFTMGSSDADMQKTLAECNATEGADTGQSCQAGWFKEPQKAVNVGDFQIARDETTNAQYNACVAAGICRRAGERISDNNIAYDANFFADANPVVGVSWNDATTFCQWVGGRLPTEVEWERAARGSDGRRYPWGDTFDSSRANLGSGHPSAVGNFPAGASPYGVLDMAGNVFEWTATQEGGNYVIRGGGWSKYYFRGRVTDRGTQLGPDFANYDIGFRCAR